MELDISLSPKILFYIGDFPISNSFLWMIIVTLIVIIGTLLARYRFKQVPGRLQAAFEILIEGSYSFVASIMGDNDYTKRVFPLAFTLFIFILVSNLIVFLPGQGLVTFDGVDGTVPFARAVMADYGVVIVLTMITVITVQIVAVVSNGPLRYIGRFFNFSKSPESKGIGGFMERILNFFLGIMDLIGELAKVVSLSFRLFGNVFAGEVLGAVILSLMPWFVPLPFQLLGLLTAVVQAFVFAVLTLVFISLALKSGEEIEA
jgi:F-type H+-transporting ATPase subunit a